MLADGNALAGAIGQAFERFKAIVNDKDIELYCSVRAVDALKKDRCGKVGFYWSNRPDIFHKVITSHTSYHKGGTTPARLLWVLQA